MTPRSLRRPCSKRERSLVYGLGPLYQVHPNASYDTPVRDGLGSVRLMVSQSGAITGAFDYLTYGAPNTGSFGTSLLGYAGELQDPSGLIYLRARWYDPGIGRFMTSDLLSGITSRPVTLHPFLYANASPSQFTDPTGLEPNTDYAKFDTYGVYSSVSIGFLGTYWTAQVGLVRTSTGELGATFSPGAGGTSAAGTVDVSAGGLISNAKRMSEFKNWFGQVGSSNKIGRVIGAQGDIAIGANRNGKLPITVVTIGPALGYSIKKPLDFTEAATRFEVHGAGTYTFVTSGWLW